MKAEVNSYLLAPFVGWVVAGTLKFIINSIKQRKFAWGLIGYGGLPSTHTSIVVTTACLLWMREGASSPVVALAITLAFIVVLDAMDLRRIIGRHAAVLNQVMITDANWKPLRERIGHRPIEVIAGAITGIICARVINAW